MRLLHVGAGNLYGGIETFLATLARHQGDAGLEHEFALSFPGRLWMELDGLGARVHDLGRTRLSRPWTVRRARARLAAVIAPGFDAVVAHGAWVQAIAGPAVRGAARPLISWIHGPPRAHCWLDRWAWRTRPDLVIANSEHTFAESRRFVSGLPTRTLYYPVDPTPARVAAYGEHVTLVHVARLEPGKGHELLLEAVEGLRRLPGWRLWLVGGAQRPAEARYELRLRARVAAAGLADRVLFLGEQRNVPDLLRQADVFCQPNVAPEAFGIACVEALYAGLPVVATDLGGPREIVTDACGRLVLPRPCALASALHELIADPILRHRLSAAAPGRARSLCDPPTALARLAGALAALPAAARLPRAAGPEHAVRTAPVGES